jgi:hypothetical protein
MKTVSKGISFRNIIVLLLLQLVFVGCISKNGSSASVNNASSSKNEDQVKHSSADIDVEPLYLEVTSKSSTFSMPLVMRKPNKAAVVNSEKPSVYSKDGALVEGFELTTEDPNNCFNNNDSFCSKERKNFLNFSFFKSSLSLNFTNLILIIIHHFLRVRF